MEGGPRTPEDVFKEFKARRSAILKALTTEVSQFYQQCDPDKENLCLYGHKDGSWEVNLPAEEVPPELPEPALGINFARDGMKENDWLALVAVHSDAWLLSLSFYFGARFGFDKDNRKQLFNMINGLPTIYEVVTGVVSNGNGNGNNNNSNGNNKKRPPIERGASNGSGKASNKPPFKGGQSKAVRAPRKEEENESESEKEDGSEESEEEEEGGGGDAVCGACGESDGQDQFWICCDLCEHWFHGKCVKITPARAEHIKHYKCPACSSSNKRSRA
ncbi:hypothetical protein LUZ60_004384 [Juncus effusus]|nr:hypothetical protein LUZ60_004384 [Juncus effusus]